MRPIVLGEVPVEDLARRLVADSDGDWELEAAARLLIEHGKWLQDSLFYRFILINDREGVFVDWASVANSLREDSVVGSHEDVVVLKVAASICHQLDAAVWEIYNLSPLAMRAIMRALAVAAGYGDRVDQWCPLEVGAG
jgi:hypothetical protein